VLRKSPQTVSVAKEPESLAMNAYQKVNLLLSQEI
jgi:hypothetical protein